MKKIYIKPTTEIIYIANQCIMMSNSEPEVTYNIGANSYGFDTEENDEGTDKNDSGLW